MRIIDIYFKDIRKTQPFTYEQEQELAREIQAGSKVALNRLIKGNLRFVVTEARRFQGRGLDLVDLIQEGNLGLIRAAKRFDPEAGFRFITYAVWWIRQSIFTALSENRMVRLPANMVGLMNQLNRAAEIFKGVELREPTDVELSSITGISLEDIRNIVPVAGPTTSLSSPIGEGEDADELGSLIEDTGSASVDDGVFSEGCTKDLLRVLCIALSEREASIVIKSFGIGCKSYSDETLGKDLQVSEERVRQLRNGAIRKLKRRPDILDILRPYLG